MNINETEERRNQLRVWLAREGLTRKEFAARLGVSEASAYGWLSCTNIPNNRWKEITAFFETTEKQPESQRRVVGSTFTDEEISQMEKAANGIPLDLFLRRCILDQTRKINSGEWKPGE